MVDSPNPVTPLLAITPLAILTEHLQAAVNLIESDQVSAEVSQHLQTALQLATGLDPYVEHCTTPESAELRAIAHATQQQDWSRLFSDGATMRQLQQEMVSGHVEGQTLKLLVRITQTRRILDIGMFTGYSALAMAEALPADGELVACEVDDFVAEFAQKLFQQSPHGSKIRVEVAPALETLDRLAQAGESFDFVFIDADKTEYIAYLKALLDSNLLATHGTICVDNTLLQGQAYLPAAERSPNGTAIAEFNQFVQDDPRLEQVLLPVRDGLTLIRRI
jgi:caffeoyl-CoA O-methyltransferase